MRKQVYPLDDRVPYQLPHEFGGKIKTMPADRDRQTCLPNLMAILRRHIQPVNMNDCWLDSIDRRAQRPPVNRDVVLKRRGYSLLGPDLDVYTHLRNAGNLRANITLAQLRVVPQRVEDLDPGRRRSGALGNHQVSIVGGVAC